MRGDFFVDATGDIFLQQVSLFFATGLIFLCTGAFFSHQCRRSSGNDDFKLKQPLKNWDNDSMFVKPTILISDEESCVYFDRKSLPSSQKQKDDVNNKIILRSIRRFYHNLYKEDNIMHVRRRFGNVKSTEFYERIKKLVQTHMLPNILSSSVLNECSYVLNNDTKLTLLDDTHENHKSLVIFLFRFIGFKPKDKVKYSDNIEQKGQEIQSCMYNYSHPKMLKILEIPEFHVIFKYVYDFHLDSMFEDDMTLKSNKKSYRAAFDKMNKALLMRSARQQTF